MKPRSTAHGNRFVHETWHDHTTSARRQHIFGKVRSLSVEARQVGEPSIWAAVAWGGVLLVVGVLLIAAVS